MKVTLRQYHTLAALMFISLIVSTEAWVHAYHQPRHWVVVATNLAASILVLIARPTRRIK